MSSTATRCFSDSRARALGRPGSTQNSCPVGGAGNTTRRETRRLALLRPTPNRYPAGLGRPLTLSQCSQPNARASDVASTPASVPNAATKACFNRGSVSRTKSVKDSAPSVSTAPHRVSPISARTDRRLRQETYARVNLRVPAGEPTATDLCAHQQKTATGPGQTQLVAAVAAAGTTRYAGCTMSTHQASSPRYHRAVHTR